MKYNSLQQEPLTTNGLILSPAKDLKGKKIKGILDYYCTLGGFWHKVQGYHFFSLIWAD